jgi:hypothetical protein
VCGPWANGSAAAVVVAIAQLLDLDDVFRTPTRYDAEEEVRSGR